MTIQLVDTSDDERGAFLLVADHIGALLNDGQVMLRAWGTPHSSYLFDLQLGISPPCLEGDPLPMLLLLHHHRSHLMRVLQEKTVLVDTPGSKFVDECSALVANGKFAAYLIKAQEHLDLMFAKSSDKGEPKVPHGDEQTRVRGHGPDLGAEAPRYGVFKLHQCA